jgi:hypothetical protein
MVTDKSHALFDRLFAATAAKVNAVIMTRIKSYAFQKSLKYRAPSKRENHELWIEIWRAEAIAW